MKSQLLLTIVLLLISLSINAEITTDGTLGSRAHLPGPDYQIRADLGQQHGGNLFHSFQDFNLSSPESATFSGPNNVSNVISRVTGGNPSNIDGLIRSTIPNADMYFLNPNGIMFGPNAQLDVQGSFHASTADYLGLGENGRFDARNPSDSILTVAPVEAFGFLDNIVAPISKEGRGEIIEADWDANPVGLNVLKGKTLSLIGGSIEIKKGTFFKTNNAILPIRLPMLSAPEGQINLIGVASSGEVVPTEAGFFDVSSFSQLADIKISDNALIKLNSEGSGNLFIRSGQFSISDSQIDAEVLDYQEGGTIDIQANKIALTNTDINGNGSAHLYLKASDSIIIRRNDNVMVGLYLKGGDVLLEAKEVVMDHAAINANTARVKNKTGSITIHADNLLLNRGALAAATFTTSQAGHINLQVKEHLNITNNSLIATITFGSGNAGNIVIKAHDINIENSRLRTTSYGRGSSGNIAIHASGQMIIAGSTPRGEASGLISMTTARYSTLYTEQLSEQGSITIEAEQLILKDGGIILTSSLSDRRSQRGATGHISIHVNGSVELSGVNHYGETSEGFGSGIYAISDGLESQSGDNGHIILQAGHLTITEGAVIKTSTRGNAKSGDIDVQVNGTVQISGNTEKIPLNLPRNAQLVYLDQFSPMSYNQSQSGIYATSENATPSAAASGNITLKAQQLILTDKGQISTSSAGGNVAGQIIIDVEKLSLERDARITSASQATNTYVFDNLAAKNQSMVATGDVVEVVDTGNGKIGYYVNVGDRLIRPTLFMTVANMDELSALKEQYRLTHGDIVEVKEIWQDQPARFIYNVDSQSPGWFKIQEELPPVILQNLTDLDQINIGLYPKGRAPYAYANGQMIQVKDAGHGKPATFIHTAYQTKSGDRGIISHTIRVTQFHLPNQAALQSLQEQTDVLNGSVATVMDGDTGIPARFIRQNNQWFQLTGKRLRVANIPEMTDLILTQPGYIAQVADNGNGQAADFIWEGKEWLPLNNRYEVANLAQRNNLNVQTGDLVKVLEAEQGQPENFLYANGKWIKQVHGGKAGTITIQAKDIRLSEASEITTEAISAGGGGITLNVNNLVFLTDSNISTSVQEGAGSGGDLTIEEPQFVIMNNGKIIAQANEGNGGNIRLGSKQLVKSPCSQISASSKRGIDGNVQIDSPDIDMDAFMVILPGGYVEAQLKHCTTKEI
ncbi:MAG: filamentous hemagglutinin N-terminal domain-containing protein, partial [Candidatus Parabeggiatoa sp.]|nr:filamentous hemagglutinin N-terminal domain-containing protein [Candidatus Parabeggiatoa sp.]